MSQALYRTYRSRALSEVVGQEHITDTLARAIKAGRISHAYLFTGPRGTGKTSVARILAHEINGLPYSDSTNLDIVEIDAASNRRIDDIRDLREKVHIAPISAKYKVYIIDEVHMLTGESFNALLKTLEEPPAHVVFILATTEVHKLPATIISRTQRFAFRPGAQDKMIAHLKMIAKKEKITIDDGALQLIAEHGEGGFRDSVSLLDQLMHITSGAITAADVASTLGLAPKEQLQQLADATIAGDHATIAKTLTELETQGSAASVLVGQLNKLLMAQADKNPSLYTLVDALLDVPHAYNPNLKLLTTLVRFAMPTRKPEPTNVAATAVTEPTVIASKPAPVSKPNKPAEPEQSKGAAVPMTAFSNDDWQKILANAKRDYTPLFGILKHAMPVLDGDTLTLYFKFAIHAKKIDDIKQKTLITEIIQKTLGTVPVIKTAVDKNALPPVASTDPHVNSVAAIMGGGEIVHGQTI